MNGEKLEQALEKYFNNVEECLKKNKRASELFPEIYGSVQGKYY